MIENISPDDIFDDIEKSEAIMEEINKVLIGQSTHICVSALLKLAVLPFVQDDKKDSWERATKAIYKLMKGEMGEFDH